MSFQNMGLWLLQIQLTSSYDETHTAQFIYFRKISQYRKLDSVCAVRAKTPASICTFSCFWCMRPWVDPQLRLSLYISKCGAYIIYIFCTVILDNEEVIVNYFFKKDLKW